MKKGTSAVPPLYASLTARMMNLNGVNAIKDKFQKGGYYSALTFHDIDSGSNGDYIATTGWDPVTGMGSFAYVTSGGAFYNGESSKTFIVISLILMLNAIITILD